MPYYTYFTYMMSSKIPYIIYRVYYRRVIGSVLNHFWVNTKLYDVGLPHVYLHTFRKTSKSAHPPSVICQTITILDNGIWCQRSWYAVIFKTMMVDKIVTCRYKIAIKTRYLQQLGVPFLQMFTPVCHNTISMITMYILWIESVVSAPTSNQYCPIIWQSIPKVAICTSVK